MEPGRRARLVQARASLPHHRRQRQGTLSQLLAVPLVITTDKMQQISVQLLRCIFSCTHASGSKMPYAWHRLHGITGHTARELSTQYPSAVLAQILTTGPLLADQFGSISRLALDRPLLPWVNSKCFTASVLDPTGQHLRPASVLNEEGSTHEAVCVACRWGGELAAALLGHGSIHRRRALRPSLLRGGLPRALRRRHRQRRRRPRRRLMRSFILGDMYDAGLLILTQERPVTPKEECHPAAQRDK